MLWVGCALLFVLAACKDDEQPQDDTSVTPPTGIVPTEDRLAVTASLEAVVIGNSANNNPCDGLLAYVDKRLQNKVATVGASTKIVIIPGDYLPQITPQQKSEIETVYLAGGAIAIITPNHEELYTFMNWLSHDGIAVPKEEKFSTISTF